jgi:pSer/pThr/pTyr-binding forkhead associated (FHA) protein
MTKVKRVDEPPEGPGRSDDSGSGDSDSSEDDITSIGTAGGLVPVGLQGAHITRVLNLPDGQAPKAKPFAKVFERVFARLKVLHDAFTKDGLLMAAVLDGRTLASHVHLRIERSPMYGIIGRHDRCELQLSDDPGVSLRHALVRATRSGHDLRLRLADLGSRTGLMTEDDLPCESLTCEGPLFLRIGRYHVFFLPTGDLSPYAWSDDHQATWAAFPERVYLDRRLPSRSSRGIAQPIKQADASQAPRGNASRVSHVTLLPAARPLRARRVTTDDDQPPIAKVILRQETNEVSFPVRDQDLERGILVGRYERCELGGIDRCLSRIHLYIVREDDEIWAMDTASTNGVAQSGEPIRQIRLSTSAALLLAGRIELEWKRLASESAQ